MGNCGELCYFVLNNTICLPVLNLIGDFEVTMDAKGRISFPSGLRKQLPEGEDAYFIANRSFEQHCINLYTKGEWDKIVSKLSGLNSFNPNIEKMKRLLMAGSAKIELDSAGRLLLPKKLIEGASIEKEVIIQAQINKMEIWGKQHYDAYLAAHSGDLADLANQIFGNNLEF